MIRSNAELYDAAEGIAAQFDARRDMKTGAAVREALVISTSASEIMGELRECFRRLSQEVDLDLRVRRSIDEAIDYLDKVLGMW